MADTTKTPKSSVITLSAGTETMVLLATRRADGSAVTTVTTKDGDKKATRGMSGAFESMEKAKEHLTALSVKAEKLGWTRRTGGFAVAKPDAFSELPAPKTAKAKGAK